MAAWTVSVTQTHFGTIPDDLEMVVGYDDGAFTVKDRDGFEFYKAGWEILGFLNFGTSEFVELPPTISTDPRFGGLGGPGAVVPVETVMNNYAAAYAYVLSWLKFNRFMTFDISTVEYEGPPVDVAWNEVMGGDNMEDGHEFIVY